MTYACPKCGKRSRTRYCPAHTPAKRSHAWSRNRDRSAQARFRKAVLERDGYRCVVCGSTTDLRAAHVRPLRDGGGYELSNGRTLCKEHDKASDPYAR